MKRLLVIEDEETIAIALRDLLTLEGFQVDVVNDGCEAERTLLAGRYDLVLLDLMLPGQDGFQVCERVRSAHVHAPIIVLTVRDAERDKVRALEMGADDYVTKPFGAAELVARVWAVLRRAEPTEDHEVYESGELRIDFARLEARQSGRDIPLTPTEFRILRTLARRDGAVVTIEELHHEVWNGVFVTDRVIYTHISHLRSKLERRRKPTLILGVRGIGYRLVQ